MIVKNIVDEYLLVVKELFEKNFLNIGLGSISLKLTSDKMIINKKNKHYLEDDFYKIVHIIKEDMSWNEVSEDVKTHSKIYEIISSTKAIANIFAVNTITFSMGNHSVLKPIDTLGKIFLERVPIIEVTKEKELAISKSLELNDIVIIKGYGVYIKSRDIREIIKKAIILENSAKILLNSHH